MTPAKAPSFRNLKSTSVEASRAMAGNSKKWTRCEQLLYKALRGKKLDPETHLSDLPGQPEFVFPEEGVVVFVDGDFWHGRDWIRRRQALRKGSNAEYWVAKIQSNIDRDQRQEAELSKAGWTVIRIWESEVLNDPVVVAVQIALRLQQVSIRK